MPAMCSSFLGTGALTMPVPRGAGIKRTRTLPHLPVTCNQWQNNNNHWYMNTQATSVVRNSTQSRFEDNAASVTNFMHFNFLVYYSVAKSLTNLIQHCSTSTTSRPPVNQHVLANLRLIGQSTCPIMGSRWHNRIWTNCNCTIRYITVFNTTTDSTS